jgi:ribonuclease P protein component
VITLENTGNKPRLGLAIAKKHLKLASQRNQLKRVVRESFRLNQSRFAGIDIVVVSRPDVVTRNSAEINAALERHWVTVVAKWQKS